MRYYRSNAVYETLEKEYEEHPFVWATGNAWVLVYGDSISQPVLLVLALGSSCNRPVYLFELVRTLSEVTDMRALALEFDDGIREIEEAVVWPDIQQTHYDACTLTELRDLFEELSLPVGNGRVRKAINDQSSSAYHNWQRSALGREIVVSDLDLFRVDGNCVTEVVELKRSFYTLSDWKPYPQDYRNFTLISKLLEKGEIGFHIVYNQRRKMPFHDDASSVSIFSYNSGSPPSSSHVGIVPFDDFVNGVHL